MFHHDIMHSIMQERARDLRAEGRAARDARTARRARAFWAELAERTTTRRASRRPTTAPQTR
ncbi:hypothetical protein [Actinomadura rubrisoli]|uniref:Uncharacterized protein n=1 Tax=Actinomadura rubrisoli TaxID=2530368 RepID=A0A4R5B6W8_9ACTN|nr:hypothetical protein [Actinomadura rubrisoli]TDD80166.1 hypothetical protein E1298_26370 [Actinomadura rubrisoli]